MSDRDYWAAYWRESIRMDRRRCSTGYSCGSTCINLKKECQKQSGNSTGRERLNKIRAIASGASPEGLGLNRLKAREAERLQRSIEGQRQSKAQELRSQRSQKRASVPDEAELRRVNLLQGGRDRDGERWQYRSSPTDPWLTANSKGAAIERARQGYAKLRPGDRLSQAERGKIADRERYEDLDRRYGTLSATQIEKRLTELDAAIASNQKAGRREFNGNGYRRTSAAVSSEAARVAGQEKLDLGFYLRERRSRGLEAPTRKGLADRFKNQPSPGFKAIQVEGIWVADKSVDVSRYGFTQAGTKRNTRASALEYVGTFGGDADEAIVAKVGSGWGVFVRNKTTPGGDGLTPEQREQLRAFGQSVKRPERLSEQGRALEQQLRGTLSTLAGSDRDLYRNVGRRMSEISGTLQRLADLEGFTLEPVTPQAPKKLGGGQSLDRPEPRTPLERARAAAEALRTGAAGLAASDRDIFRAGTDFLRAGQEFVKTYEALNEQERALFEGSGRPPRSAINAASRTKPVETIEFAKPIEGPSGARLVSYSWKWTPQEYTDNRGEERVKRISDWEQAERNIETGRDVVHQFVIERGSDRSVVSAETAIKLLGYDSPADRSRFQGIQSATRSVARLRMAQAELDAVSKRWEKDWTEVSMAKPPQAVVQDRGGDRIWKIGGAEALQRVVNGKPVIDDMTARWLAVDEWRSLQMQERGWTEREAKRQHGGDLERDRDRLSSRLKRAERALKDQVATGGSSNQWAGLTKPVGGSGRVGYAKPRDFDVLLSDPSAVVMTRAVDSRAAAEARAEEFQSRRLRSGTDRGGEFYVFGRATSRFGGYGGWQVLQLGGEG